MSLQSDATAVFRGEPISSLHQPDPEEIADLFGKVEANLSASDFTAGLESYPDGTRLRISDFDVVTKAEAGSGGDFTNSASPTPIQAYRLDKRQAETFEYLKTIVADGEILPGLMDGLLYRRLDSETGSSTTTSDLSTPAIKYAGPVELQHFAAITEDSTDIAPIVERALNVIGGEEDLHIPVGSWRWETAITLDPSGYAALANRACGPRMIGQNGTILNTSVDGSPMLKIGVPSGVSTDITNNMKISGFELKVLGSPTDPQGIELALARQFEITDIQATNINRVIGFAAADGGDVDGCSNGVLSSIKALLPTGGEGLYFAPDATDLNSLTAAFLEINDVSIHNGAIPARLSNVKGVNFNRCNFINGTSSNVLIKKDGLHCEDVWFHDSEFGNNSTGTDPAMIEIEALLRGGTEQCRFTRGASEVGTKGYYFKVVGGALINDLRSKHDRLTIDNDAVDFTFLFDDGGAAVNGFELINPSAPVRPTNFAWRNASAQDNVGQRTISQTGTGTITVDLSVPNTLYEVTSTGSSPTIERDGHPGHGDRIMMRLNNESGGATTFALSGFVGTNPVIPDGKSAFAELVCQYRAGAILWYVLGGGTFTIEP